MRLRDVIASILYVFLLLTPYIIFIALLFTNWPVALVFAIWATCKYKGWIE